MRDLKTKTADPECRMVAEKEMGDEPNAHPPFWLCLAYSFFSASASGTSFRYSP